MGNVGIEATRFLVGAIDFGTTYSGWAFSFKHEYEADPTKATVKHWLSKSGNLVTNKTPTCLLIKPDGKTFQAFGYDAENEFRDLVDKNQHGNYYFFKRFKMKLFKKLGKDLKRDITLEDEFGKSLLATDIFAMSVKFLADDMLANAGKGIDGILKSSEIHWVLTVPAIWSDAAKQLMREAAGKAGICKERLTIALEPEAASLYCRHLSVHKNVGSSEFSISKLPDGSTYIVVDAGGGTIDVTVHETGSAHTLREVRAASGGDWGGTMVDKAFENLLITVVGKEVYDKFKVEETEDWLDMLREFECKKRETMVDSNSRIGMRFPVSLADLLAETQCSIHENITSSKYVGMIEQRRDRIKFSNEVFINLFEDSLKKTTSHIKSLMSEGMMKEVKVLLMVGGYSESPLLQHAIKEALPEIQVVIPYDASSVVLRGALIFGHNPLSVTERILKYTYGTTYTPLFVEGKHPESKRFTSDDGDRCLDVFSKFIELGQTVKPGETQITKSYFTLKKDQLALLFEIYATEKSDPLFSDEEGCVEIGKLRIELDKECDEPERAVKLSMLFGGTEIIVEVEDEVTGNKNITTLDFLG
ncbi:heat shock 70 kDa protein 12B-like [Mercenaria mercenaria]|uniref:heat shock 70 kDa protein 12B-like n=1 Tax=Mercenaria mercenaria TaxID=6596 RepID=UPI00234EFDFA|nr:heat shock 70 kDa protein 12B-like [Mercenaria mercenaria]